MIDQISRCHDLAMLTYTGNHHSERQRSWRMLIPVVETQKVINEISLCFSLKHNQCAAFRQWVIRL